MLNKKAQVQGIVMGVGMALILGIILYGIIFSQTGLQTQGCLVTGESFNAGTDYNGTGYNGTGKSYVANYPYIATTLSVLNETDSAWSRGTQYAESNVTAGSFIIADTASTLNNDNLTLAYRYECGDYLTNTQARNTMSKVPTILIAFLVLLVVIAVMALMGRR